MGEVPTLTREQERELLMRAKQDPRVVGEIYDLFADRLYGFLLKRCRQKELAEDLVSRSFLKLIESLDKIEWQGVSINAWLYRVASNALIDHWRSGQHRFEQTVDDDADWDPPAIDQNPAWHAEIAFEHDRLVEIIGTMSIRDQQVLDLRFFAGLEVEEIAKTLGISPNHASVLIYRATGRLRTAYLAANQTSS